MITNPQQFSGIYCLLIERLVNLSLYLSVYLEAEEKLAKFIHDFILIFVNAPISC